MSNTKWYSKNLGLGGRGGIIFSSAWRGSSAILDQGFSSGGNFVINILLARWLGASGYGAFALCFSTLWLIVTIQQSVVSEPLLVFAKGRFGTETYSYLRCIIKFNRLVALVVAAALGILVICLAVTGNSSLAWAFGGLALAIPTLYEALLCRRMAFAFGKPQIAARGSVIYFLLLVGGVIAVYFTHHLSAFWTFIVLGVAALGVVATIRLRMLSDFSSEPAPGASWRKYVSAHIVYGRWALPGGLCQWIPVNLALIYLAGSVGLASAGGYRALFNLAQPALQVNAALGLLLIPIFVRKLSAGQSFPIIVRTVAGPIGLSVLYGIVLVFVGRPLLHLFYGGEYLDLTKALWLVAIIPVVTSISSMLGAVLRAKERPSLIFWARAAGAVVVVAGWPLLSPYNVFWALFLTTAGLVIAALSLTLMVFLPLLPRARRAFPRN